MQAHLPGWFLENSFDYALPRCATASFRQRYSISLKLIDAEIVAACVYVCSMGCKMLLCYKL